MDDVTRDDAVRVVAEAMESCCEQCALDPDQGIWRDATRAVAALVAAGWGDLTAARREAVQEMTRNLVEGFRDAGWGDVADGVEAKTRHLWTTTEEAQP